MKRVILIILVLLFIFLSPRFSNAASDLNGTYVNKENKKEYITFSSDGKFFLKQQKKPNDMEHPYISIEGKYTTDGDAVTLKLPDGGEATGKIKGDTFLDSSDSPWVKEGAPQKMDQEMRPKRSPSTRW